LERLLDAMAEGGARLVVSAILVLASLLVGTRALSSDDSSDEPSVRIANSPLVEVNQPSIFGGVTINPPLGPIRWDTARVVAEDAEGKTVDVTIGVLDDTYRWRLGSTSEVGIDWTERVPLEEIIRRLDPAEARPIIAIGTASHENALDNPEEEDARAATRADRIAAVVMDHFKDNPEIHSLNLGSFRQTNALPDQSSVERRVILVVINRRDPGVDLDSGIRNALAEAAENDRFTWKATSYSNFDAGKFRVQERRTPPSE
jgi:hypothetical protein